MRTSKLISLCKATIFIFFMTVSCQASADYYIEYIHDPCVDYQACGGPVHHVRHHTRSSYHPHHHHVNHVRHYRHSSAELSVTYYWEVYPNPCADSCGEMAHCNSCCNHCSRAYSHNEERGGVPLAYHENDYRSSYYSAASDLDYDTSTADDVHYRY
jgi:hypothetical protein